MSTFVAGGAVDPDDGKGHLRRGAASRPMLPTPGARENTFATVTARGELFTATGSSPLIVEDTSGLRCTFWRRIFYLQIIFQEIQR